MPKHGAFSDGFEAGGSFNPQFALCHITDVASVKQSSLDDNAQLRWHLNTIDEQKAVGAATAYEGFGTLDTSNRTWPVMDTIRPGTVTKTGDSGKVAYVVTGVVPCYLPTNADALTFTNFDVLCRTGTATQCGAIQMAWWTIKMKGST
tara:strand:- start:833 stop:1276 length:444 start_codon:yes stop_codon:yes gene_type:complete